MEDFMLFQIFEDRKTKLTLTSQQEKDILSMRAIIGENNVDLQADGNLLIRHYVGFVQINKTRLLIYPKIARNSKDEEIYDKAFQILIKLLSYSGFDCVKKLPTPQQMGKYKGDLLELFIGIFVDELLQRFKRDVNRSYNYTMENQSFIKGKIDFQETIKKNSYRKHLHYVRYDEFTEDIMLNRIFKAVLSNLIQKTTVNKNIVKLRQALLWLEDVESVRLDNEVWGRVKFTRLNLTYEPVFNMAKLFYYNSGPNLNKGNELAFSFLVPLNQLFERFVFELLSRAVDEDKVVKYQGPIRYLADIEGINYLQLKPDITILKDKKVVMILDAKYKEILDSEGKVAVSQADVYQMLAYSVKYQCDDIALVYPKFLCSDNEEVLVSKLSIDNYSRRVSIRLLQVDLEESTDKIFENIREYIEPYKIWVPNVN